MKRVCLLFSSVFVAFDTITVFSCKKDKKLEECLYYAIVFFVSKERQNNKHKYQTVNANISILQFRVQGGQVMK